MTEILTESFCERCGTRYTFESAAPRRSRLGRVRTLSKGFRNFVLSDETTFSEALADARSEEELAATSHQLDAFHKTFNFCLTCRQYTCGQCWNETEGRCLTCAPIPGREEPVTFEAAPPLAVDVAFAGNGHAEIEGLDVSEWPEIDLPPDRIARAVDGVAAAPLEPDAEAAEPALEAWAAAAAAEPHQATAVELVVWEPEAEHVAQAGQVQPAGFETAVDDTAAVEAVPEPDRAASAHSIAGIEPGQSLAEAIAAYEAQLAAQEAAGAARATEPEPVATVDAAPVAEAERVAADALLAEAAADALLAEAALPDVLAEPVAAEEAAVEPEPIPAPEVAFAPEAAAAAVETEPVLAAGAAVEPEPVAAEPVLAAVEPEPVAAEPAAPGPEAAPRVDVIPQPAWPTSAPAGAPGQAAPVEPARTPVSPWLTVAPDVPPGPGQTPALPQWPVRPQWPAAAQEDVPRTFAGRPVLPSPDASALWAASSREVLAGQPLGVPPSSGRPAFPSASVGPAAQPCVSCGLPLSANARFCRRCGSRQG